MRPIVVALVVTLASGACGPAAAPELVRPQASARVVIVASERGPQGARLVALDEKGDRQFELLVSPDGTARDSHPALSPDGRWIVFASSRGRSLEETSLWIAPLAADAVPTRLTDASAIESHPTWTRDGRSIVFASTRDGGDFDLWKLDVVDGRAQGAAVALTSGDGHEVTPTTARDGSIFYTSVTPGPGHAVESHIERRAPDGLIERVTDGPADSAPSLSPDERTLVFARPVEHAVGLDAELWTFDRATPGARPEVAVDLAMTDESGAAFSSDGRFLFATSVLRGEHGAVVFSSVIVVDLQARPRVARLLEDRVAPIARLTPAIARGPLDATALANNPEYLPELARIIHSAVAREREPSPSP